MPKMLNTESNVELEITLLNNSFLDIDISREDFMNWIPFDLKLNVCGSILTYSEGVLLSFSVNELKYLFKNLNRIIQIKSEGNFIEIPFEYTSSENLFDLIIHETLEENQVYIDMWFDMGSLTNGIVFGFNKGFRFIIELEVFRKFVFKLEEQFTCILKECGYKEQRDLK